MTYRHPFRIGPVIVFVCLIVFGCNAQPENEVNNEPGQASVPPKTFDKFGIAFDYPGNLELTVEGPRGDSLEGTAMLSDDVVILSLAVYKGKKAEMSPENYLATERNKIEAANAKLRDPSLATKIADAERILLDRHAKGFTETRIHEANKEKTVTETYAVRLPEDRLLTLKLTIKDHGKSYEKTQFETLFFSRIKQPIEYIVSIEFPRKQLRFTQAEIAKGQKIHYTIRVREDVKGVVPQPQDSGRKTQPTESGLYPFERIQGNNQSYDVSDTGIEEGYKDSMVIIRKGVYPCSFEWEGKNWKGPNCHGRLPEKPFPPGVYTLTVSANGYMERKANENFVPRYEIKNSTKIIITK